MQELPPGRELHCTTAILIYFSDVKISFFRHLFPGLWKIERLPFLSNTKYLSIWGKYVISKADPRVLGLSLLGLKVSTFRRESKLIIDTDLCIDSSNTILLLSFLKKSFLPERSQSFLEDPFATK